VRTFAKENNKNSLKKNTENTCYLNNGRQVANHLRNIKWKNSLTENMEPADFTHMSYFDT